MGAYKNTGGESGEEKNGEKKRHSVFTTPKKAIALQATSTSSPI